MLQKFNMRTSVLQIRNTRSGAFLTPGSGIPDGRKPDLGSGIRNKHPESLVLMFWVKNSKYFKFLMRIRIRDPVPL
jgi:hypothetical protein